MRSTRLPSAMRRNGQDRENHLRRHRYPRASDRSGRAIRGAVRRRRRERRKTRQGRQDRGRADRLRARRAERRGPEGLDVAIDADLNGLKAALAAGKLKHVAIANPETAPYGRAAQESLKKAGMWEQVQPLLVIGENIGQTATFVSTGAAEVGFIAKSLAISKEIGPKIDSAVVPGRLARADRPRYGGDQGRFARSQGVR